MRIGRLSPSKITADKGLRSSIFAADAVKEEVPDWLSEIFGVMLAQDLAESVSLTTSAVVLTLVVGWGWSKQTKACKNISLMEKSAVRQ